MDINNRQNEILKAVQQLGSATIEELASRFDVTLQTVRRDVHRLSEEGLLTRFHGGVRTPSSTTENIAYRQRQEMNFAAKTAMAEVVAKRVPNGCSIMMNIGTTMEAVAKALVRHKDLRVITNNLNVAAILSENPDCEVIVTGGVVRQIDKGITGEATVDFIKQFKVDIALIGISGIEEDGTLRDFDFREVKVSRAILDHCRQSWLIADASKFGRPAMVELGSLTDVDVLFTDKSPPTLFEAALEQAGTELVVVHPNS